MKGEKENTHTQSHVSLQERKKMSSFCQRDVITQQSENAFLCERYHISLLTILEYCNLAYTQAKQWLNILLQHFLHQFDLWLGFLLIKSILWMFSGENLHLNCCFPSCTWTLLYSMSQRIMNMKANHFVCITHPCITKYKSVTHLITLCVYKCCDCASACVLVLNKVRCDVCSLVSFEP